MWVFGRSGRSGRGCFRIARLFLFARSLFFKRPFFSFVCARTCVCGVRACAAYTWVGEWGLTANRFALAMLPLGLPELYSHTKSLCSQMFGVASQQGWAGVFNKVRENNRAAASRALVCTLGKFIIIPSS